MSGQPRHPERRAFLESLTAAGALALGARAARAAAQDAPSPAPRPKRALRFAVIGLNHAHIYGQTDAALGGGGELLSFFAVEPDLIKAYSAKYPQARLVRSEQEILEDDSIRLVVSASIPSERAPLGLRVMRHGKDFMSDKPGITTLEQLAEVRRVRAETKRIYSICYSERFGVRAAVRAGELVKAGAIGRVLHTVGLGPHRMNAPTRPEWYFDKARAGGILTDIGSHQLDQFLFFTGSTRAEVVAAQSGNVAHPQYPRLDDFGEVMVRGDHGTGYVRVDWFTPNGLNTWGDGRLTILGTEGFIELRKYVDLAGRAGGDHLFLVDQKETRYVDCRDQELPYGRQLVDDVLDRTETAMPQEHCFLATELALRAQKMAEEKPLG